MLTVPLVRLLVPVWPPPVEERLDEQGRPILSLVEARRDEPEPRSRPLSAAVLDRVEGGSTIGYVVGLRDPDGETRPPPNAPLWWPMIELAECSLGITVERTLDWQPCDTVLRVHHPNRMSTFDRLQVAVDRLNRMRHQTETSAR